MTFISSRRKAGPRSLAGRVLTIVGIPFIVIAALITVYTLISLSSTVSTRGTILSCASPQGNCEPTVSFQTQTGQQITFHASISSTTFAPGDAVAVRYHPDDPQDAQLDPSLLTVPLAAAFGGVGLLLIVVGLILRLFAKNPSSADLVTQYYTAFKNQDYATAFQYLNPAMMTPQGQPTTQGWFTQRALEYDTTHGKVLNQTISGFSLSSGRAKFTVLVTRAGKSYRVHLHLLKEGDIWKINSFDLF